MSRFSAVLVVYLMIVPGLGKAEEPVPGKPTELPSRILPGIQPDGSMQMPNQWSLRPAGKQIELGDFPVNLALHPGGAWMAVLHAGYGKHEVMIVDLKQQEVKTRVTLDQAFYGLCFAPDGKHLYASGGEYEVVHAFDFADGLLSHERQFAIVKPKKEKFIPAGLAVDAGGETLFVAGPWGDAVASVPLKDPENSRSSRWPRKAIPSPVCRTPAGSGCSLACGTRPPSASST